MTQTHAKWYQEPIVWLIWGLLISVVLACMVTIVLAIKSDDGLVMDDYYREGLAINRSLNAKDIALSLGVTARIDAEPSLITVSLASEQALSNDTDLTLHWAHPTNRRLDANVVLPLANASRINNEYRWQLSPSTMGLYDQWQHHRWHIVLAANTVDNPWRIQGVMPVCCNHAAILKAQ